jgi:hypothetical protein
MGYRTEEESCILRENTCIEAYAKMELNNKLKN